MVVKEFVQDSLAAGEVIALVSLNVQDAFDAAWWPAILKEMRLRKPQKSLQTYKKLLHTAYSNFGSKEHKNGERVK